MSLSVNGIGTVSILFPPLGGPAHYGQNPSATNGSADTTLGHEAGAAAVVYAPGPVDPIQPLTYSQPDQAQRIANLPSTATRRDSVSSSSDAAVVEATGAAMASRPPVFPAAHDRAGAAQPVIQIQASARPVMPDIAGAIANGQAAPPVQSDASVQSAYALVADAALEKAPLADLPKFA